MYDIDENGFITKKKMTDTIDAISSMVDNTKMKICQRIESGKRFLSDGNGEILSRLISSPELKVNEELIGWHLSQHFCMCPFTFSQIFSFKLLDQSKPNFE